MSESDRTDNIDVEESQVKKDPRALGMQLFMTGMLKILEAKEDSDCQQAVKRIKGVLNEK